MHLLSNIWSDVSLMETDSGTEMEREWKTEKINQVASNAHNIRQSGAKTKSKTTVQVCPGTRQEFSFIRLAIIQTQEWTAVLKKTISVSKLHPTEAAFLCWMSNGVWSIPYPKI